jgi:NADH dehydrogenase
MWAFVHVFLLIGFRNRLMVMREWIWAYFTRERSARLITGYTDVEGKKPGLIEAEAARVSKSERKG